MDKFESLALWMALEISKNSDGDYAKLETRIAWSVWQSRQAEFDAMTEALLNQTQLLAKQKVEVDALNDNHLAYIDKVIAMESDYLEKIEEKDKRIEELEMWIKGQIETLKCASKSWVYTEREQNLMLSQADDLEKALRGKDQYTEHHSRDEQQINKGARLTKHQIDLGDKNANS
jgi:RecA/RadA recombinase